MAKELVGDHLEFPTAALKEIARILRAGAVLKEWQLLLTSSVAVYQWAAHTIPEIWDPALKSGFAEPAIVSNLTAAETCDKLIAAQEADADGFAAMDWKALMKALLKYLLPLILK